MNEEGAGIGERNTEQKRVILEELRKVKTHPTAKTLYERVRERVPGISFGTVYRNLNLMERESLIQSFEIIGKSRFDGNPENHYHFFCQNCEKMEDLNLDVLKNLNRKVENQTKGKVWYHKMIFFGLCQSCKN